MLSTRFLPQIPLSNIKVSFFGVLYFTLIAQSSLLALPPLNAPNLAVEDVIAGTHSEGANSVSINTIRVHLSSYENPPKKYLVQCFFFKRNAPPTDPSIDDTVLIDATPPYGDYEVKANDIQLPPPVKIPKPSKHPKIIPLPQSWKVAPRDGYVVRVVCEGTVLNNYGSGFVLETLAKEHPEIFDQAALGKSARHLQ